MTIQQLDATPAQVCSRLLLLFSIVSNVNRILEFSAFFSTDQSKRVLLLLIIRGLYEKNDLHTAQSVARMLPNEKHPGVLWALKGGKSSITDLELKDLGNKLYVDETISLISPSN